MPSQVLFCFIENNIQIVTHGSYFMIKTKILSKYIDDNDLFILLLSSLCHDVDHTGRNNGFESASLSKLAIRYHDESVIKYNLKY